LAKAAENELPSALQKARWTSSGFNIAREKTKCSLANRTTKMSLIKSLGINIFYKIF
jgi:hypothetical protein